MKKQTLYLGTALFGICCLCASFSAQARPYPTDFEFSIAQGDGDPTELTADDLNAVETETATLTAEGDFLVPTYLLPTTTPEQNKKALMPVVPVSPIPMSEGAKPTTAQQPVVVVGQNRLMTPVAKPQQMTVEKSEPRVAGKIEKKPLLLPLAPIVENQPTDTIVVPTKERRVVPSALADTLLANLEQDKKGDFLLPHEIKISFYQNATALSGQTLKWIKAFALQTIRDPRLMVEIRVSQNQPALQAKRLAVVKNALLGTGLSTHQLLISYTKRPTDSFIIRAIEKTQDVDITQKTTPSGKTIEKRTIKW